MDTETSGTLAEDNPGTEPEISEEAARAHEIAPAHTRDVEIETVDPDREVSLEVPAPRAAPRGTGVDLNQFGATFHAALEDSVTGYMWQVRKHGSLVFTGQWEWSQTPADAGAGWGPDIRMHVASVSKFLTAVGVVRLLNAKNISVDSAIQPYLPTYWPKGSNIGKITFRHLLTHTSGFSTGGSATDFATMKARVAAGVPAVGAYDYENMNFGLCRILISTINGAIAPGKVFGFLNDAVWDATTISAYRKYMQANVFTPAGVANASFEPAPFAVGGALAYRFPHLNQDGWNSGDLSTVSGGAGWRLSMKELLNVMDHVRRKNTIIPAGVAQTMLDDRFGIDQIIPTAQGNLYNKNGAWANNGRREQSVAFFWPDGMEMAAFVNSPIGVSGASLRNLVSDTYKSSL